MKRFLFAFLIAMIVFAGVCAMVWADISSRSISGGDSSLFSYEVQSYSTSKLELFGKPYYIDRAKLRDAGEKISGYLGLCSAALSDITPDFIENFADGLYNGFSGLIFDLSRSEGDAGTDEPATSAGAFFS